MNLHFAKYGVQALADVNMARLVVGRCRKNIGRALRGRDMVEIFQLAKQRWLAEPIWRSRSLACIESFGSGHADPVLLDAIPLMLDAELWETRLSIELSLPRALDGVSESHRTQAMLAYRALGVILHICPGNSYLGGIDSLLHGLITGNQNLVKLSRGAPAVMSILVELLGACGLPECQVELVCWDSGNSIIKSTVSKLVDGVVVWGNDASIRDYKTTVPMGVRFLEYGPKLSFSLITAKARYDDIALAALVEDACAYEQVSCSSSQFLLVEIQSHEDAQRVRKNILERIGVHFNAYAQRHPPLLKSKHEYVEMLKTWEGAKLAKSQDRGAFLSGYPDWLVVWMDDDFIKPSSLFRTWLIYTYENKNALAEYLEPIRHYLQSASVSCDLDELKSVTEVLWAAGVQRVVGPGRSNVPTGGAPHDGGSILAGMCRFVSLESPKRRNSLWKSGGNDNTLAALKELTHYARRAPFYARQFEARIDSWEEFRRLPWLMKDDFYIYGPPHSDELLTKPYIETQGAYLFTTGGSTGEPKYALYSKNEWDEGSDIFCRALEAVGVNRNDRVANLFNAGGLWSAFMVVSNGLEKLGCLNLPVGGAMEPHEMLTLLKSLQATAIYGLPSILLRLAHAAEREPRLSICIPKILYGGEHMSEAMCGYIKDVFKAQFVRSPLYASADAGCIGYQCEHAPNGVFHALEEYAHIEICSAETKQPLFSGEEGEIIVTNLSRRLLPVLRLRTGDRGYEVKGSCACGAGNLRFRLLGRSDDMVRIGGANVHLSDVERLCQRFDDALSFVFQLRIDRLNLDDRYELCIETKKILSDVDRESLALEVRRSYLNIAKEVSEYIDDGILLHFKLSLVSPKTLIGNAKTGKIRRVIDER
jgi:phenylacetate-CoA ligase